MTNTMSYKGYAARIEYDDDDGIFTGRIAGIRDGAGFHADTGVGATHASPLRRNAHAVQQGRFIIRRIGRRLPNRGCERFSLPTIPPLLGSAEFRGSRHAARRSSLEHARR